MFTQDEALEELLPAGWYVQCMMYCHKQWFCKIANHDEETALGFGSTASEALLTAIEEGI